MSRSNRRRKNCHPSVSKSKMDEELAAPMLDACSDKIENAKASVDITLPNGSFGRFIILPKVSISVTLLYYFLVSLVFFFAPAYMTYSVVYRDVSLFVILCMFAIPMLMVCSFGAVASLPLTFLICGIMLSKMASPQLLIAIILFYFVLYFSVTSRPTRQLKTEKDLSDEGLKQLTKALEKNRPRINKAFKINIFLAVLAITFAFIHAILVNDYRIVIFSLSLVFLFIPCAMDVSYDKAVLHEKAGHRYAPWITVRYMDREVLKFLKDRFAGLLLFVFLYSTIIFGFSVAYYYIDNCERHNDYICNIVNTEPFLQSTTTGLNFSNINVQTCGEGQVCTTTFGPFLPYLYFSVVTSTTVGYGDISPKSVTAAWLVIVHHLLAIGLLIGVAGQVAGFVAKEQMR